MKTTTQREPGGIFGVYFRVSLAGGFFRSCGGLRNFTLVERINFLRAEVLQARSQYICCGALQGRSVHLMESLE